MSLLTRNVVASAARTTTGSGTGVATSGSQLGITLNVTAVSGTSPTLVLNVQWSSDGTNFGPADTTADAFASVNATTVVSKAFTAKAPFYRVAWTIGGTTPSFTFSVDAAEW